MEKFHHYTFARHVIAQSSDHKPLETIVPGPLWKSSKRLHTLKLRLQKYDNCEISYKGKRMHIADALSCAYLPDAVRGKEKDTIDVNLIQHIFISPDRRRLLYFCGR